MSEMAVDFVADPHAPQSDVMSPSESLPVLVTRRSATRASFAVKLRNCASHTVPPSCAIAQPTSVEEASEVLEVVVIEDAKPLELDPQRLLGHSPRMGGGAEVGEQVIDIV